MDPIQIVNFIDQNAVATLQAQVLALQLVNNNSSY